MKTLSHWKRHCAVLGVVITLASVVTILILTQLIDLGGNAGILQLSHSYVESEVLKMLWICVGVFVAIATLGALLLRDGIKAIVPYIGGLVSLPVAIYYLDKVY